MHFSLYPPFMRKTKNQKFEGPFLRSNFFSCIVFLWQSNYVKLRLIKLFFLTWINNYFKKNRNLYHYLVILMTSYDGFCINCFWLMRKFQKWYFEAIYFKKSKWNNILLFWKLIAKFGVIWSHFSTFLWQI